VPAVPTFGAMKPKSELKRLTEAVRKAEAELDAARTRSALSGAARKLMCARAELRRLQEETAGATRPGASRAGARVGAS
jgi:hypothetical protein